MLCFIKSKEWTLFLTSKANFASPHPKSAIVWFFGALCWMCLIIKSTGFTGHFLTWVEKPKNFLLKTLIKKQNFLLKQQNLGRKLKIRSKIEIITKNLSFVSKTRILVKNPNFLVKYRNVGRRSKLRSKPKKLLVHENG